MRTSFIKIVAVIGTMIAGSVVAAVPLPEIRTDEKKNELVILTDKNNGEIVQVPLGSIIEIRLAGTRANTGWEGGGVKGDVLVHLNGKKGQDGQAPSRPGLQALPFGSEFSPQPGAADKAIGTYVFIYQAVKEGRTELTLDYITPGGPGVFQRLRSARIAQFKVNIHVTAEKGKS